MLKTLEQKMRQSRMLKTLKRRIRNKEDSRNIFWKILFFGKNFLTVASCSIRRTPPSTILIDPTNICNLDCPLCATGAKKVNYRKCMMPITTFKTVIDKIPSLKHVGLYNWGEPFLNPEIFQMIEYTRKKNILVSIHSNFSFKRDDDFFVKIVKSGLNVLTLSIDGASQDSYSKYRVGGNFNLVISNIKRLINTKDQLQRNNPTITWKFIVNKYNENEIEEAKKIADKLGTYFMTSRMGLSDDLPDIDFDENIEERKKDWLPKNNNYIYEYYRKEYNPPLYKTICTQLFNSLVVTPDGKVFPCCLATDKNNTYGDLLKDSFEDIWNNVKYQYSRSLFIYTISKPKKIQTVCSICHNFKKR